MERFSTDVALDGALLVVEVARVRGLEQRSRACTPARALNTCYRVSACTHVLHMYARVKGVCAC